MDLLLEVLREQEKGASMDRLPPGYGLDHGDPDRIVMFDSNDKIIGMYPATTTAAELIHMAWLHYAANREEG
jgi:hypothetical protein